MFGLMGKDGFIGFRDHCLSVVAREIVDDGLGFPAGPRCRVWLY